MDKIAFHIGSFPIHWYGVLVAAGFWLGLWSSTRRAEKAGILPERVWDAGLWIIIGTIIGARTLHVITYWDQDFAGKPISEIFMVQHGGLVFYGGLIGATLSSIIFLRLKKLPMWKFGDALAPGIPLGYAIGRMGCLMNGCCYGKPTDLPWGLHYPPPHEAAGHAVHPTQIYDAGLNLLLYLALAWLYRRKKFDGQIFAAYLLCYAVTRSVVEIFRGDYAQRYLGGVATPAHLVSMATFLTGAALYWILSHRPARPALATTGSGKGEGGAKAAPRAPANSPTPSAAQPKSRNAGAP